MADRLIPTTYADLQAAAAAANNDDRLVIEGAHPAGAISLNLDALSNITIINTSGAPQIANITVGAMKAGAGTIVTGGAGLRLVFGAGTNPEVSNGKSLTTDSNVTFVSVQAVGFTGNPTGGTLTLNGSHLEGIGGAAGTVWFGDTPGLTVVMTGGTITTARSLINTTGGAGATAVVRRVIATDLYNAFEFAGGSFSLHARKCVFEASNKAVLASSAGGTPIANIEGCILSGAVQDIDKTVATPGGTWTFKDNWGQTVDAWGTWDYNAYQTLVAGAGGAHDVVTAVPGFVGGGDWHTTVGSPLRGAGTLTGETVDLDGNPCPSGPEEDIGPYEFQWVDCGVDSAAQVDSTHADVTFASFGGDAVPLQASAQDITKWSVATTGPALSISASIKQSPLVYRLTFNRVLDVEDVTVTALGTMVSDEGGVCDNPTGAAMFTAVEIDCGIASLVQTGANTATATFVPAPTGSAKPVEASAENVGLWSLTTNAPVLFGSIAIATSTKAGDYIYNLVFTRDFVNGEYLVAGTALIVTDLGGNCDTPPTAAMTIAVEDPAAPEGPLAALLGATGHLLAQLIGTAETRLRIALTRTATTIEVESTLGFPDSGTLNVQGEYITYTGRIATSFTGCTRDTVNNAALYPTGWNSWPISTSVYSTDQQWSSTDLAISDTRYASCSSALLDWLANDVGAQRPISFMTDADLRLYLSVLWFLDRTTWWSVFRVLSAMFGWVAKEGTDGQWVFDGAEWWFESGSMFIATTRNLHDNWIWIDDKLCRIVVAKRMPATIRLQVEPVDWPFWEGVIHDHGGVPHDWQIVPFRIVQNIGGEYITAGGAISSSEKASSFAVYLYASVSTVPYTYLMANSAQKIILLDNRPIAGKLMSSTPGPFDPGPYAAGMENDPGNPNFGNMKAPLYALAPYRTTTKAVLADVVSAATRVSVLDLSA